MNKRISTLEDLPKILPAYDDETFQSIFTLPEAEKALISAVSAFLGRPIKSVILKSNKTAKRHKTEKHPVYDINCVVDGKGGDQCEVEMQAKSMFGDGIANENENIRWRSVFNLTKLHTGQDGRSKPYARLRRSYQIMLCNYKVFKRKQSLVERFTLRSKNGYELCDAITSIFIDLTKARTIAKKPVSDMTELEMWVIFIGLANNLRYAGVIDEIAKRMEGIAVANTILQSISQSEEARANYLNRSKARQDEEHRKACEREVRAIEKNIKVLKKDIETQKKQIEAQEKQNETQKKQNEAQRKQNETQKKQNETQKKQNETQKKQNETQSKDIDAQKKDVEAQSKDIETQKKDIDAQKKDVEAQSKDIEAQKIDIEAQKKQNEAIRKSLEEEEKSLKEREKHFKDKGNRLESEFAEVKAELAHKNTELAELHSRIAALEAINKGEK